jgi:hypothetical protein
LARLAVSKDAAKLRPTLKVIAVRRREATRMAVMTKQLDKIFIGYDTPHGDACDSDAPVAFLIVMQHGEIEAYASLEAIQKGTPLHWEVCHNISAANREVALLEARRAAAGYGLVRISSTQRQPVVTGHCTVISSKTTGPALKLENSRLQ